MSLIELNLNEFTNQEQILNLSLTLCSLINKEIKIKNIKKLNTSSLNLISILKKGTNAYVEGAIENSDEIYFSPAKLFSTKKITISINDYKEIISQIFLLSILLDNPILLKVELNNQANDLFLDILKETTLKIIKLLIEKISVKQNINEFQIRIVPKENKSSLKLNYPKDLINIKGQILTSNKNSHLAEKLEVLFKISLNKSTISIQKSHQNSEEEKILLLLIGYFGENHSFDNSNPYVKTMKKEISSNQELVQIQKDTLEFIKDFNNKLGKKGIDTFSSKTFLPYLAFFKGEIEVEEIDLQIKEEIEIINKLMDVKIQINGNKIFCLNSLNTIPSINNI